MENDINTRLDGDSKRFSADNLVNYLSNKLDCLSLDNSSENESVINLIEIFEKQSS